MSGLLKYLTNSGKLTFSDKLLEAIEQQLDHYRNDLNEAKEYLTIKGKTVTQASKEQSTWPYYCDERKIELNSMVKELEKSLEFVHSSLFKDYTEKSNLGLGERAKEKYINGEPAYIQIQSLIIEVSEVRDKFAALVDAFRTRGYAIRNVTDVLLKEIQDLEI